MEPVEESGGKLVPSQLADVAPPVRPPSQMRGNSGGEINISISSCRSHTRTTGGRDAGGVPPGARRGRAYHGKAGWAARLLFCK